MDDYKENIFMQRVSLTVLVLVIFAALLLLSGCGLNKAITENVAEEDFTSGCKATHASTTLGYFSQTGTAAVPCKVKCSPKLPKNYYFKYSAKTPYGNCTAQVGQYPSGEQQ